MINNENNIIPTAIFDGSLLSPADRLEAWRQLTPGYDNVLPAEVAPDDFTISCRGWLLDDLVVTANAVSPVELIRTSAHIAEYARDTYTFILLTRGEWWAELDHGTMNVGTGQVCIMDFTVPWIVHGAAQENVMIVIPRSVVAALAPNAPRLHGRLLEGASGRMFAENMLALARHLPELNERDVRLVREATLSLLAGALHALSPAQPLPVSRAPRTVSLEKVRTFIDRNLTNPDLGVELICGELAVTRPSLYRAFAPVNGVASYIQHRRLEAAHSRLSETAGSVSMTEIAGEFCFSSSAHFSTAFRRRFGYSPRQAKRSPAKTAATRNLFWSWVEKLSPEDA